jgi:hypothetical protein
MARSAGCGSSRAEFADQVSDVIDKAFPKYSGAS